MSENPDTVMAKQVAQPEHPAEEAAPSNATRTGSIDDAQSDALGGTGMTYAGQGAPPHAET